MGDLSVDAELADLGDGTYSCELSRDWEIWGPNGGYMAAIALQAARAASGRPRPANATVHFLSAASFDEPVAVTPVVQRSTRVATSVRVAVTQGDRPVLEAMVWALDDLEQRSGLDPVYLDWIRFASAGAADPWAEAARLLLLVDLGAWPAANRLHVQSDYIAPSIDVSCEFHHLGQHGGWYLLRGASPVAGEGLIASHQEVWDDQGRLLASGISHLLCRAIR